jgi:hypothetical protein
MSGIITLEFRCPVVHVRHQRLSTSDLHNLKDCWEDCEGDTNAFLENYLDGGGVFDEEVCSFYGPLASKLKLQRRNKGVRINVEEQTEEREVYTDEDVDEGQVDFFYIASGMGAGTIILELYEEGEKFDPSLLSFVVSEYEFGGYLDRAGSVITSVLYNGEEVEFDLEDEELVEERYVIGNEFENTKWVGHIPFVVANADGVSVDFEGVA